MGNYSQKLHRNGMLRLLSQNLAVYPLRLGQAACLMM
jgi:hypothetical protein